MSSHSRRNRRAEIARNRILLLLGLLAVVLVAVIFITAQREQPAAASGSVAPPATSASSVAAAPSDSSAAGSGEGDGSTSQTDSSSETSSASQSDSSVSQSASSAASQPASSTPAVQDAYYEEELPMLVNPTNQIPEGYSPTLADIGSGYKLQERAAAAFLDMMKKAQQDSVGLWVVSAYRSHEKQTTNFNNKIREFESMGYTATEAYAATAMLIAVPGTSEHSLGYAVDLNSLETTFEGTKQFTWLTQNCADFGFVLRYPKDKVEITEISYEPWHYRYVGSNHARIIMEKGICLEEYLSGDY